MPSDQLAEGLPIALACSRGQDTIWGAGDVRRVSHVPAILNQGLMRAQAELCLAEAFLDASKIYTKNDRKIFGFMVHKNIDNISKYLLT
jgi:hypothetical protein